jgi:hypothetical protein
MQPLEGELGARRDIVGVVERRQIRYAHMVGVTPEIMQQGMRADYTLVNRLSERLLERMHQGRSVEVRTDAGTSLRATFDHKPSIGGPPSGDVSGQCVARPRVHRAELQL